MRFWTSDLHFGHPKMLRERPFKTLVKHDEHLVKRWNKQVKDGDEVWILGDLTPLRLARIEGLLSRMAGEKKLILGNHDTAHPLHVGWEKEWQEASRLFSFVGTTAVVRVDAHPVMMNHFPYARKGEVRTRFAEHRVPNAGKFLLHGHTHTAPKKSGPAQLHVGWNAWGRLVTERDVRKALREWKAQEAAGKTAR